MNRPDLTYFLFVNLKFNELLTFKKLREIIARRNQWLFCLLIWK